MNLSKQNRLLALFMAVAMIVAMLPVGMAMPVAAADGMYSVDFNEAEDLNDFQAYYADDAKNGLTQAEMAANWAISNGMVSRVQPAGKQYWMSNADAYAANGVGETNYGMVAELVYTGRTYTNFELTVDATQVSGISRQFGIGFGKTQLGAFFVDSDGQANVNGGAYACVERGGSTNLWGYAVNTVNGSTGALVGGRVQGTTVSSGNSVVHNVKVRVENGAMSMWVKTGDADYVQVLTNVALKNYNGGYISLMSSANASFDNLTIMNLDPQIISVESGLELDVAKGTAQEQISFPQTVSVTDDSGNVYQVPVTFACTSYNADELGTYNFVGTLDVSGMAIQNGSGLTASVTVNVLSAAEIAAKVSIDFNESTDLSGFASYYAKNARDGLTATAFAEDWTNDGNVVRIAKPHGIGGFWQSNSDGNGVYGYVAELVYTQRQYTNFELTVDAMQVAESIGRQFGIGFGKTELGAFFVDNDNQMNAAGGAYVGVERNGATSLWGYAVNTVNGSTNAIASNGRVSGTAVTSPSSKWHTVKVRVEDSKVSFWVKDLGAEDSTYVQVLNNVALKNYTGGYISLMTNANAAFDNLTIINLDPQIVSVGAMTEIIVAQGTAAEDIAFPAQVTVTDENGGTHKASVSFNGESYNADTLGQYTFVGELNLDGVAAQNGSGLTASVVVNVMSAADAAARFNVDFNEAEDLNDFASYYAKNARDGLTETVFAEDWTNDGNVARLAKPHGIGGYWQSNNDGNGTYGYLAELVYTKRQFTNFELTVDAMQVAESIARQFGIGFGKTELGAFFVDNDNQMNVAGGAYVGVERNGATNLWGYAVETVIGSTGALANNARVQGTTVTSPVGKWHTVKVRVENSAVSMWVKDLGADDSTYVQVLTDVALKNYTGGYISLMTNANAAFDNLSIINLDPQIVSVGAVNEIVVAQGTAAEDIDFPAQVTVTDENGDTHNASVNFSCDSYNAAQLGQYTFTGALDLDGVAAQNGNGLTAFVAVKVLSAEDFAARVSIDFNEAEDLNDFASYYAQNARDGLTETAFAEDWTNDGNVARIAKPHGIGGYWQSNVDGNGTYGYLAELVYTKRQFTNFELTVDAMQVAESIARQFGIGFGKTELGAFFVDNDNQMNVAGGAYVGVERNGATNLWGYAVETVIGSTGALANNARVQGTTVDSPVGKWHTVKVRVEDGKVSMWVKDLGAEDSAYVQVLTDVALKNYIGGYISLMTNANAAFDNLLIVDLGASQEATVEKWNISLGDDIGANFYISIPEEQVENTNVSITVGDSTASVNASTVTEDGYYVYSTNVAAAQMTEEIVVKIECGGSVAEQSYSVYEYAQYILEDANNEFDEKAEALVKEMLNYGAAAQSYFGYNTENAIDADLIAGAGAVAFDASDVSAMSVTGSAEGIRFYGASLLFQNKTTVRLYFTGNGKFTVNGQTLTAVQNGSLWYVDVEDIAPQGLADAITVTVNGTLEVTYSPMNYMARMLEKGSDSLQLLLNAMYNYHLAAVAFVG